MKRIRDIAKNILWIKKLFYVFRHIDGTLRFRGDKCQCPVCEKSFARYIQAKGDVYCPFYNSSVRVRLVAIYLRSNTKIFTEACSVLHFAPEWGLSKALMKSDEASYMSCDIEKGRAMKVVDITDITFDDETFQYIICNHVLEHVPDDKKAMSELYRVLKPGGTALITVPTSKNETTLDAHIESDEKRAEMYGQKDHLRLYGKDLSKRIASVGFEVSVFRSKTEIPKEQTDKLGLQPGGKVFIAHKK